MEWVEERFLVNCGRRLLVRNSGEVIPFDMSTGSESAETHARISRELNVRRVFSVWAVKRRTPPKRKRQEGTAAERSASRRKRVAMQREQTTHAKKTELRCTVCGRTSKYHLWRNDGGGRWFGGLWEGKCEACHYRIRDIPMLSYLFQSFN